LTAGLGEWRIRRLMIQIKDAATAFARRQGDEGFLAMIHRLTARKDEGSSPWRRLAVWMCEGRSPTRRQGR
jgi:hypothetical protein